MTPFSFVRRMMDDMDRLFEGFGSGMIGSDLFEEAPLETPTELGQMGWTPQIEMVERDGKLFVRADLPGLDKKDIRVNLEDDAIVIEGERRTASEDKREGYLHSERSYGSFQRRIPLPRGVEPSSCDATFENGVLEVKLELPKSVGRSVEIRGGAPAEAAQTGQVASGTQPPLNQTMNQPATRSNQNGPAASR
jgi:HSP20 family protein